jgi:hypothetical protein
MLYNKRFTAAVLALLSTASLAMHNAGASTVGDTVTMDLRFPSLASAPQFSSTTKVGAESSSFDLANFTGIVSNGQIVFDAWELTSRFEDAGFNGVVVTDLNQDWGKFAVNKATNMTGFSASDISITGNVMAINFSGLAFNEQTKVVLDVAAVAGVPEPDTYALLFAGLGLIGFVMRRKRSA